VAKKSIVAREKRKFLLVEKYRERREELRSLVKSSVDINDVIAAQTKLAKLPLNSNSVRYSSRCEQCGRTHAIYRKFGLCRICLRQQLMTGNVPGGRKSSW